MGNKLRWFLMFALIYVPLLTYCFHKQFIPPPAKEHFKLFKNQPCDVLNKNSCQNLTCVNVKQDIPILDFDTVTRDGLGVIEKNLSENEGRCLPASKGQCNPFTGREILAERNGQLTYICECIYPHLLSQWEVHGDCIKQVACEPGGYLYNIDSVTNEDDDPQQVNLTEIDFDPVEKGRCYCDDGYLPTHNNKSGPNCVPAMWFNFELFDDTSMRGKHKKFKSHWKINEEGVISHGYDPNLLNNPVFKMPKPCKYDPRGDIQDPSSFNNKNEFREGYGCVCDWDNGWIGIKTSNSAEEDTGGLGLTGEFYDACTKIPINSHRSVTHFYRPESKHPVVTYHIYEMQKGVNGTDKLLADKGTIVIKEEWTDTEHDYFKRKLKTNLGLYRLNKEPLTVRFSQFESPYIWVPHEPFRKCSEVSKNMIERLQLERVLYYKNILCISEDERPMFKNQIILNPLAAQNTSSIVGKFYSNIIQHTRFDAVELKYRTIQIPNWNTGRLVYENTDTWVITPFLYRNDSHNIPTS